MISIKIVDYGQDRYRLIQSFDILGRMYDNNAESIKVAKPKTETDSDCTMIITSGNTVVDHIEVKDDPILISNNISQYRNVNIGFSFSRADGYIKNTEVCTFKFLEAQRPDGFIAEKAIQSGNIDNIVLYGFTSVGWKEGGHNTLEFKNIHGDVVQEIDLHGFSQEQADLAEKDETKITFVQGKKTSNLENDGDGTSPFATQQFVLENHEADLVEGNILMLGADGVVQSNRVVFKVQNADDFVQYRTHLREFLIDGLLPLVGQLDDNLLVAMEFGDTVYNLYQYLNASTPLKVGDLKSEMSYNTETGYRFFFKAIFMQTSDVVGFVAMPSLFTAQQLNQLMTTDENLSLTLNSSQTALNLTLSQDLINQLTEIEETDPTIPQHIKAISEEDINNWNEKASTEYVEDIEKDARKVLVLGATGTIGTNANFEVNDSESYLPYRNNLTEFIFSGIIPVTGEIDLTKEVTITFGDTSYYLLSAVNTAKRLTLGDLDFALRESLATGYNYLFRTVFFENSDTVGFAVLPDKEDVLSLDSDQMDNFMAEGGLPNGQLAICSKVIVNGYTEGGIYRFKITYPSTYEWEELVPSRIGELTLNQIGSMLQSTQTFTDHVHAMIEFDTDGVHYGADFVLHPCDSAICLVSYRFGTHDGTAYLDFDGHVNISIPDNLTFTSFKGHYIKL